MASLTDFSRYVTVLCLQLSGGSHNCESTT